MNRWSLKIAEPFGIAVYVHASFLLIVAWVALGQLGSGGGIGGALASVLFLLALFVCVALHELGHALAAARYGIPTRDITLLPIGGLARLERLPSKPSQELVVALAGPAVNVAIAAALGAWLGIGASILGSVANGFGGSFLERLLVVNLGLVVFNLIPAFPMDGGRVLRALLAMRIGALRATRIAAAVGKGIAVLFGALGLFFNPFLVLIAVFVWFGASQEAAMAEARARPAIPMWGGDGPHDRSAAEQARLLHLAAVRAELAAVERRLADELRRGGSRP